jgi:hypothetical protein
MASYLGQKKVEEDLTQWLHCACLCMLGNKATGLQQQPQVKKMLLMMNDNEPEWRKVCTCLPHHSITNVLWCCRKSLHAA